MSYSIDLLFKNLKKDELNDFILKFKNKVREEESVKEILQSNISYSPCSVISNYKKDRGHIIQQLTEGWLLKVFNAKFIYIEEHNLLVVVYYPYKCIRPLFDGYLYAQNSCDQDYPYGVWNGIPSFEKIRDGVLKADPSKFLEPDDKDKEVTPEALEYRKKVFIFKEIFEKILEPLVWYYNEKAFYISCFYETIEIIKLREKVENMVIVEALRTMPILVNKHPEEEWLNNLEVLYPKYLAERILKRWKNGERYD